MVTGLAMLRHSGATCHCCSPCSLDRNTKPRGSAKPEVTVTLVRCGKCGQPYNNSFTHTCKVKTDFKARKKRHEAEIRKAAAAARRAAKPRHSYSACRDKNCPRAACVAYREGREEGYDAGYRAGRE